MRFTTVAIITVALASMVSAAPMSIQRRRFGQEHTARADGDFQAMKDISVGTGFEADLGNLSGAAVRALLAKAPACDQQDVADQMIDIAVKIKAQKPDGPKKFKDLIAVAKDYRTLERNTPGTGQASELCTKVPKHKELRGLVQAQDPTGTGATPPDTGATPPATGTTPPAAGTTPPAAGTLTPGQKITVTNDAFDKPVGGIAPPEIVVNQDGNASVNGDRFLQVDNAIARACDVQKNLCFNAFNGAPSNQKPFQGSDCENQRSTCTTGPIVMK